MREGWEIKAFDACIEKRKAPTKLLSSSYQKKGLYPIVSQEKDLISGYWDNPDDLFVHRKPVVVFGDHTMVVKYIDFDFVVGADGVIILEPKEFLLPKYFFYWVSSVHIKSRGYARHYRYLREASVPIPYLPEQQRIVDILDREFAKIDALKANAEKSLQAAKDLFQATVKKELEPKEGWIQQELGTLADFKNGLNFGKEVGNSRFRFLGVGDFKDNLCVDVNTLGQIQKDEIDDDYLLHENDIVFVRSNGSKQLVGRCLLVKNAKEKATFSGFCIRCRLKGEDLLPQFLIHFCTMEETKQYLTSSGEGCNISNLNQRVLSSLTICAPKSREEQARIVAIIEHNRENIGALQENYQKALTLCDELKQSLLRRAFNGEL